MDQLNNLNKSKCYDSPGIEDIDNWNEIVESCSTLGMTEQFKEIF